MTSHDESAEWRVNYFNYFTEVEEQFQKSRGTGLFLLSPLDWALIESWKNSGVPLEAALRGIDIAFEKWRQKKVRSQRVNSLAYCAQAVLEQAQTMADNRTATALPQESEAPFPIESVRQHLEKARSALIAVAGFSTIADSISTLLAALEDHFGDLEDLEQRLTALEDKMAAIARTTLTDEQLLAMRKRLASELAPYRGKMSAEQLVRLEKSYLDRAVYDLLALPRLSLFYLT